MAPRPWTSQEAQEFVNTFYSRYQVCQATKDYSTFWPPFFEAWNEKYPERLVVFPDIPLDQDLDIEQKDIVKDAYQLRKDKLVNKLRNDWGTSKASRKAKNHREKVGIDAAASILAARQTKGMRSLSVYEAYSKLYYASCIKPVVDAEMQMLKRAKCGDLQPNDGENEYGKDVEGNDVSQKKCEVKRVTVVKRITKEMYEKETDEVKDEVAAYIKQMAEKKTQALGTRDAEIDHQKTIDQLVDILTEFFQELQRLTGWSFSVLMGGPTPVLGGKIDVSSFHIGRTEMGNLFSDAFPNFNSGVMKPWLEFINQVFPTAAAKALVEGQGMNEALPPTMASAPDDVLSHDKADTLASALAPPLDESEELERLAENYLATMGHSLPELGLPMPDHAGHSLSLLPLSSPPPPSPTLPFSEVNTEDPYDFSWPSPPPMGTPSQGHAGPSNLSLPSSNPPWLSGQGDFTFPQASCPPSHDQCPLPASSAMATMQPTQGNTSLDSVIDPQAAPSLSPPGQEEVPSAAPPIDKPAGFSEKRKHQEDKQSAEPLAESPVDSRPKRVRTGSRRNEIANSIGQDKTAQKKSAAQENQKKTVG
ncbi:hypothetical protein DEU56DRAFT_915399 [Suillus clintonianus]|uniref:uncharacterized protein n=1 Tax=Suillus clintonianus TaxID=1904413 RepID=UPI001B87E043|nr:uncharacterized protein DEU56DRAFT_915399 [Suillus clintonianus]KAG2128729.1 hypothetical protein DEU56DRAFT_915399 [Suillus clintonianus]